MKQKITTFLTFNNQAEEAARYYVSLFQNSSINHVQHMGNEGQIISVLFTLNGQEFIALNGGPSFVFSQGISLLVDCETQEEVDTLWNQFCAEGTEQPCGWLKDKFGVSWQIIPSELGKYLGDADPQRANRAMTAMLKMKKIDIAILKAAADDPNYS